MKTTGTNDILHNLINTARLLAQSAALRCAVWQTEREAQRSAVAA